MKNDLVEIKSIGCSIATFHSSSKVESIDPSKSNDHTSPGSTLLFQDSGDHLQGEVANYVKHFYLPLCDQEPPGLIKSVLEAAVILENENTVRPAQIDLYQFTPANVRTRRKSYYLGLLSFGS